MPCPTCDHTMHLVGYANLNNAKPPAVRHCPRCGTSKTGEMELIGTRPTLVDRLREFEKTLGPSWLALWKKLGIAEAINLPENRPE